jgi:hypothetical protein
VYPQYLAPHLQHHPLAQPPPTKSPNSSESRISTLEKKERIRTKKRNWRTIDSEQC